ncbi:vesicle-associated membrane protein 714-like [Anneissia japonica]|uniref:vesicle-associated membrane protein 714-like n=1 Tax=Anneissia japonica TaxID=1529436 RepID=UPI0014255128|nr:vesicle-associated membrane protein 714-like [Anneissia japonica]XP_033127344.1 vesicle-associated membrane protein 714-like [Anneissia japonica]
MPILYCCVARGHDILVEAYTSDSSEGNFSQVASSALRNLSTNTDYKTIYKAAEQYLFLVYVRNGVTYLCVIDRDFNKGTANEYLLDVIEKTEGYTRDQPDGRSDFTEQQKNEITKEMRKQKITKLDKVQGEVDELKDILVQNLEKILSRGDKLDVLMDKAEQLEIHAHAFQKTAKKTEGRFKDRNRRYKILLGVVIAVIIIIVIVVPIALSL